MDKPRNLEEVRDLIFNTLKQKYGEAVISEKGSDQIVILTNTCYCGNNDVWIDLSYFH